MRTLAIVLGGVGAGGVAAVLAFTGPSPQAQQAAAPPDSLTAPVISDTGSLKGPRQPIFFRHDIHAGQFKIQCQYCHYSVNVSPEPGIPVDADLHGVSPDRGRERHRQQGRDPEAAEGLEREEAGRVGPGAFLPRHAHFPHQRHIKALGPNACATCHGDVTRMPQVFKVQQRGQHGLLHHLPHRARRLAGLHRLPLLTWRDEMHHREDRKPSCLTTDEPSPVSTGAASSPCWACHRCGSRWR